MTKSENVKTTIEVILVTYPGVLSSALYGWQDLFSLANRISLADETNDSTYFSTHIWRATDLPPRLNAQLVLLPPSLDEHFYQQPDSALIEQLKTFHRQGAILASACAGAFLLAATGLLDGKSVTTHWRLADSLQQQYRKVRVDSNQILINEGDVITAGGLMSWLDLGLELVQQFAGSQLMLSLGKTLVVDTAPRLQSYYKVFRPVFSHGDKSVLKVQHFLQRNISTSLSISQMAEEAVLEKRTLLRRFVQATGYKPTEYLQQLRVQKARDLLERSRLPVEKIAVEVGYEDASAFRKVFKRITQLTPSEFRLRFNRNNAQ